MRNARGYCQNQVQNNLVELITVGDIHGDKLALETLLKRLVKGELDPAYCYWFLLKDMMPQLCIDIGGKLYTREGGTHDLAAIYLQHKKVWPVIAETAIQLLP